MSSRSSGNPALALALGLALLAGILVDWSPHYWRVGLPVVALALVGTIWALTARRVDLPAQTILIVLIALWAPIQIALHLTRVPWPTTQRSIEWAIDGICFILGSQILRGRRNIDAFLNLMLAAMTFLAVAAMLQMYASPGRVFGMIPVADSVVGTIYYKNWFAAMMEMGAPIALWQVYNGKVLAGGICYAAMFAATVSSASRMGVILLLAEFLVGLMLFVVGRRMRMKSAVALVAVLALLVTAAAEVAGTEKIQDRMRETNPYGLRQTLLSSTLKMIPAHPWIGSGIGTWPSEYPRFATYDMNLYVNAAHNDWAQWVSEGGIPFFLLIVALVVWLIKPSIQSVWGMGVLSLAIHSWVDYPLQDPALAFLWFSLAGALTRMDAPKRTRRSETQSEAD